MEAIKADKVVVGNELKPNPEIEKANIHDLLQIYDQSFFNGDLEGKVLLEWSQRMTQCAGICYLDQAAVDSGKGLFCVVRLSYPLLKYRSLAELYETLLHELIHAWLWLTKTRKELNIGRDGHGPDFTKKMNQINAETGLRLSVYHSFRDEVYKAQGHVWLCDGTCSTKPPFFGRVARANNRPPGPQDWWFSEH